MYERITNNLPYQWSRRCYNNWRNKLKLENGLTCTKRRSLGFLNYFTTNHIKLQFNLPPTPTKNLINIPCEILIFVVRKICWWLYKDFSWKYHMKGWSNKLRTCTKKWLLTTLLEMSELKFDPKYCCVWDNHGYMMKYSSKQRRKMLNDNQKFLQLILK